MEVWTPEEQSTPKGGASEPGFQQPSFPRPAPTQLDPWKVQAGAEEPRGWGAPGVKSRRLGRDPGRRGRTGQENLKPSRSPLAFSQVSVAGPQAARGSETARGRTLAETPPPTPLCVLALAPHPLQSQSSVVPGVRTSSEGAESRGGRPSPVPARRDRPRGLSCQRRSSSLLRFASERGCRPRPEEPPGPKRQFALQWVKPELSAAPLEGTHPLSPASERGVYPVPTTRQQPAKAELKAPVFK